MHFIIMGCGRVGSNLATTLLDSGHTVSVVDSNPASLNSLQDRKGLNKVIGFGFDDDTLKRAGVQNAFSFAAVTDNDNTNVLAARVAKEKFHVEKVVARVYNPSHAEFFEKLGLPTVATLKWTENQILRKMIPIGSTDVFQDSNGKVVISEVDFDETWITKTVKQIEAAVDARVAFIQRRGSTFIPSQTDKLQEFDSLFILSATEKSDSISHTLAKRFELAKEGEK